MRMLSVDEMEGTEWMSWRGQSRQDGGGRVDNMEDFVYTR